jgi:hypothetical protein
MNREWRRSTSGEEEGPVNEDELGDVYGAAGLGYRDLHRVFTDTELEELVQDGPAEDLLRRTAVRLLHRVQELQRDSPVGQGPLEEGVLSEGAVEEEPGPVLDRASHARLRMLYTEGQIRDLVQTAPKGKPLSPDTRSWLVRLQDTFRRRRGAG